jgi:hypothetical protein
MVGDVGMGDGSAGAADGGAEDGPEVVVGARVVLGAGAGGVGGKGMALGAGAGAEWSGVRTGTIECDCGGRREGAKALRSVIQSALGSVAAANGPEEA